jgi:Uma2 family endonuclease
MLCEVIRMTLTVQYPLQRSVFHSVSWEEYVHTLDELFAASLHAHVTFDNGEMEIMTTGDIHERQKKAVARLIETYALEAGIPITGLGEATCRREDLLKGLDPDECYYVNTPVLPASEGSAPLDLMTFAPPDLAIEIDVSNSSIPKQPIYAALGVAEIWRYADQRLRLFVLTTSGKYEERERGLAFPSLSIVQMNHFLQLALTQSSHKAALDIRDWVRAGGV